MADVIKPDPNLRFLELYQKQKILIMPLDLPPT